MIYDFSGNYFYRLIYRCCQISHRVHREIFTWDSCKGCSVAQRLKTEGRIGGETDDDALFQFKQEGLRPYPSGITAH